MGCVHGRHPPEQATQDDDLGVEDVDEAGEAQAEPAADVE